MSWFGSSSRKTAFFYVVLIAIVSLVVGMVIASRLGISSTSSAQTLAIPATNSAPLSGPIDATTFRNIAKAQSPMVVSIRTESRQRTQDLSEFFGGPGGDDLLERFFGPGAGQSSTRTATAASRAARGSSDGGRRIWFHHQQRRLHPDEQPRRRGCNED